MVSINEKETKKYNPGKLYKTNINTQIYKIDGSVSVSSDYVIKIRDVVVITLKKNEVIMFVKQSKTQHPTKTSFYFLYKGSYLMDNVSSDTVLYFNTFKEVS